MLLYNIIGKEKIVRMCKMINAIFGMSFSGLVELAITSVYFYYVFCFFVVLIVITLIQIYEKDWEGLKETIGWYFLVAYGILFAISILSIIVGFIFQQDFAQNGIQLKTILIFSVISFVIAQICWKIGDNLAFGEQHKFEKEWGTEKEIQKIINIVGYDNWLFKISKNREERIELLRKLRNKEKIVYIDKELLY
jgi:glucan phosphoethanolaminetransferase (alkaline phosphatase superfamily)